MNSRFEQRNTQPTMEEIQAMQKTALRRSMDKAGNIQKAITLTEENWTGLTTAVEMTGQSVLKLQQSVSHLLTDEQMDAMLKAQLQSLLAEHNAAVAEMKRTVAELNRSSTEYWQRMQRTATESLNDLQREQTQALKEFEKQVGRVSERYSSELSATTDSIKQSANRIRWQMYLPSIILVLWELMRHLLLRG